MKKSKKVIIMLIILLVSLTIGTSIYGYFTYKASRENTIILGYNKIELNEEYTPPTNMKEQIEQGNEVSYTKEPYVTNTGSVDCYVRVKSEVSDSRVKDYLSIDYNSSEDINDDSKDWYYYDGYYYYKEAITPGDSTEPLFTTVTIASNADNIVLEGFDIYVYAESVQTVENKNMMEVWNYFN